MNITYKEINSIVEFIDAIRIRVDVFIIEQKGKPGWEPDEEDKVCRHFVAIIEGKIVSTVRVRESALNEIKIERMATKKEYRGKGFSKGLIDYVLKKIEELKPKRIWMESQVYAQEFYEKSGFKPISEPYDLWGIPHVMMEYKK